MVTHLGVLDEMHVMCVGRREKSPASTAGMALVVT
jgi:hypothetical protein